MFRILKIIKNIFVIVVVFLFVVFLLSRGHVYEQGELEYGLTFSKKQINRLNLDWQEAYTDILDKLGVKKIRLSAYWDEIEREAGDFNWDDIDWQINEAGTRDVSIILALGGRLPRWPECHYPGWTNRLSGEERNTKILDYIKKVVERYRDNENIIAWQVENEPFLSHFGECEKLDKELLDREIDLVRSLDSRPVVITDSGELSVWISAAKRADIFGTTMYRDTYSKRLKRYVHYPISPGFFRFKKNITSIFAHPQKWIVIELQAEPWGPIDYQKMTKEEKSITMDLEKFREIIEFASQTGFKEFYLWGVEWWYWEKEQGNSEMWDEARGLFVED